jgi:hypothetical protein
MKRRLPVMVPAAGLALALAVLGTTEAQEDGQPCVPHTDVASEMELPLPDGTPFRTWSVDVPPTHTYWVDQLHAAASDDNPGTESEPFKTIGRAAQLLQPGERVVVRGGTYRERVAPARGGTGPTAMVSYEAAPGEQVAIKGSVILSGPWHPMGGEPVLWLVPLPACGADEEDPFTLDNVLPPDFEQMTWAHALRGTIPYTLPRGMVFQDGRRLEQVAGTNDLVQSAGTFWVDRAARELHVRPFDDGDPAAAVFEVTVRGTVFGPTEPGLGYIRVKGFRVEQAGNAFPMPQQGALSTTRGHHWIIEDNRVAGVNGVGIDIGKQAWWWPQPQTAVGHHIVRRNVVTDCGVCGIAGLGPGGGHDFGLLIENNLLMRNAYHDVDALCETAGIKTHGNINCMIRHNVVLDTLHGPGIWLDFDNENSRCYANTIMRANKGIFVEASNRANLVDHNVILLVDGHGIYEHDSCGQTFTDNVVVDCTRNAFQLRGKVSDREIRGEPIREGGHRVLRNVIEGNKSGIKAKGPGNVIE